MPVIQPVSESDFCLRVIIKICHHRHLFYVFVANICSMDTFQFITNGTEFRDQISVRIGRLDIVECDGPRQMPLIQCDLAIPDMIFSSTIFSFYPVHKGRIAVCVIHILCRNFLCNSKRGLLYLVFCFQDLFHKVVVFIDGKSQLVPRYYIWIWSGNLLKIISTPWDFLKDCFSIFIRHLLIQKDSVRAVKPVNCTGD